MDPEMICIIQKGLLAKTQLLIIFSLYLSIRVDFKSLLDDDHFHFLKPFFMIQGW